MRGFTKKVGSQDKVLVLSLLSSVLDLDVNMQDLKIPLIKLRISTKTHMKNSRNAFWIGYLSFGAEGATGRHLVEELISNFTLTTSPTPWFSLTNTF